MAGTLRDTDQVLREFFQHDLGWDTVFERLESARGDFVNKAARSPTVEHDRRVGALEGFESAIGTLKLLRKQLSAPRKDSDG